MNSDAQTELVVAFLGPVIAYKVLLRKCHICSSQPYIPDYRWRICQYVLGHWHSSSQIFYEFSLHEIVPQV